MSEESIADQISFRALQRLAAQVTPQESMPELLPTASNTLLPAIKLSRREQQERESAARWRRNKWAILESLRDLRAQEESGVLQATDLRRAALFSVPPASEIPPMPLWRGLYGAVRPAQEDQSDEAEEWRAELARRIEILQLRHRARPQVQMLPYKCWPDFAKNTDRGGLIPGQLAYPSGWNAYLLRIDEPGGDGWNSVVGLAWRRMERVERESRLARAVWLYTDPRRPEMGMERVRIGLSVKRVQAYRWLDAGARRLSAEMVVIMSGRDRARAEIREAEDAEATAWQVDARIAVLEA